MADEGLLGGFSQGIRGAIQGMYDAEDRDFKRKEMAARLASAQTEEQRKFDDQDIEAAKAGFRVEREAGGRVKGLVKDPNLGKPEKVFSPLEEEEKKAEIAFKKSQTQKNVYEMSKPKPNEDFAALPKDQQIEVEKLMGKVSDRKQIRNDINSFLKQLKDPNLTEDEKILAGKEAIKTLNSVQGSDAVGAEEAKRLSELLEFRLMPRGLTGDPGDNFGRDLDLFTKQVENNANRIDESIANSQGRIDQLMGRQTGGGLIGRSAGLIGKKKAGLIQPPAAKAAPATTPSAKIKVSNGKETLLIDPSDLAAAEKDGFRQAK